MRIVRVLITAWIALIASIGAVAAGAVPDISGAWQGTLHGPAGNFRLVFQISRDAGDWKAKLYSLDTVPDPFPVAKVSLTGSTVTIQMADSPQIYQGAISADGTSLTGTLTPPGLPLVLQHATPPTAWDLYDNAKSTFVTVEHNVRLEVLDWGGTGRPVILLAGLGNSARVFDKFAPHLTRWYHVYGVTRRGFGESSAPATGYSADRLGDDVLAVIHALKIERPVLIGHSVAGEELSDIGSRYPQEVAGLVYLDAGYGYASYARPKDASTPTIPPGIDLYIDATELQQHLRQILFTSDARSRITSIDALLQTDLSQVREDLQAQKRALEAGEQDLAQLDTTPIQRAILAGMQKFSQIHAPILAIYADPHSGIPIPKNTTKAKAEAQNQASVEWQIAALKRYNPSAQIVRIPNAIHYLYVSNEAEALNQIHAFIDRLPASPP